MTYWTSRFKKFIKDRWYKLKPVLVEYEKQHDTKKKSVEVSWYLLNIVATGLVIAYFVHPTDVWHPAFLRYGLLAAVSMYYLSWLIQEIKRK
jgi:hypothetical protein